MIIGKFNERSQSTQSSPRIPRISHIQLLPHQQANIGSTSHRICYFAILEGLQSILNSDILQQLLTMLRVKYLIQIPERLLQSLTIITLLKILIPLQHLRQFLSAELRDLHAAVSIEDSEEKDLLTDPMEEEGILHVLAPTCVEERVPCISHVMTRILPCWYLLTRLVVTGCERNAPPIFYY